MRNRKRQNWFIKGEQKSIKEKIVGRRMLPTNWVIGLNSSAASWTNLNVISIGRSKQ